MKVLRLCNPNELFHVDPSLFLLWKNMSEESEVLKVKFC